MRGKNKCSEAFSKLGHISVWFTPVFIGGTHFDFSESYLHFMLATHWKQPIRWEELFWRTVMKQVKTTLLQTKHNA